MALMYLLDTNICIYIINRRPSYVREKLLSMQPSSVCLSAISVGELEYGAFKSNKPARNIEAIRKFTVPFDILHFDDRDAEMFGLIRADLERRGCVIGPYDMQIAAQALARNIVLVTNNTKEFERIPGLKLENWA